MSADLLSDLSRDSIKILIGEMGIQILTLVHTGCSTVRDLMRFSSLSRDCLDVKIPLLVMLGLINDDSGNYRLTQLGEGILEALTD
ncbi:MAG: winged helix-turn-helix domain-containing protein [Candidatus Thorarchaeota archaeon]